MTMDRSSSTKLLSIECLKGTSTADEWNGNMLQTGDIVDQIKIGKHMSVQSPFDKGKSGVQKLLHTSYKRNDSSINVRVRRGEDEFLELQACIVPNGKTSYILRAIADPNYAVGFCDRTESECYALQASRNSRVVSALTNAKLQEVNASYPWERRMQEVLHVPNSSSFLSILLLPKASDRVTAHYNDLEDTLARSNTWLNAAQASGVPIVFMNIQTESLLTNMSGETASSTVHAGSVSDLSNIATASLYGLEDYHGVDIGVVRAVRLWYSPLGGEFPIHINLEEDDAKLGFAISRTEEGFIFISSVIDGDEKAPSTRSGLSNLYKEAKNSSMLLVVSRVSNQKVLPWMVSLTGAVRCFDTVSISHKLSLHRHAKVPIVLHVFMWDRLSLPSPIITRGPSGGNMQAVAPTAPPLPPEVRLAVQPNDNQIQPLSEPEIKPEGLVTRVLRDTVGEHSFRFQDFSLSNKWV